jgi:hypothetical protein
MLSLNCVTTLATIRRNALRWLTPPPRLQLSEWIEAFIRLPERVSALLGAIKFYPYQREVADAVSDPEVVGPFLLPFAKLADQRAVLNPAREHRDP